MKINTYDSFSSNETSRLLYDSVRIAKETEDIGNATAEELIMQGEKLKSTKNYLDSMKSLTDNARVSIKGIKSKVLRKKLYLWIIIIGLFLANFSVIVTLIRNHGKLFSSYRYISRK
mmetsp:Transcript_24402/g.33469  ORF Transcript_24402/g.33469 Transcript_24402/m.33469 type:complete len:117 (+) Transcript_24402:259-609(+)